jgi:predicted DNA-binding transcriptional regulator AlpA
MPRQTRKIRQTRPQPQPRQVRAEEASHKEADPHPSSEEFYDEVLDEFVEDEEDEIDEPPLEIDEAQQPEAELDAPPDQMRVSRDAELSESIDYESWDEIVEDEFDGNKHWYEGFPVLVTSSELGELLNVNRTTVYSWRMVGFLPKPIRVLPQIGAVWLRDEIRDWLASGKWADDERARTVYKLFKEHGEDINEWISPKPPEDDYLYATVPVGISDNDKPVRNEQTDAALDDIEQAFDRLEQLRGTALESEALALIANRLSHITNMADPGRSPHYGERI